MHVPSDLDWLFISAYMKQVIFCQLDRYEIFMVCVDPLFRPRSIPWNSLSISKLRHKFQLDGRILCSVRSGFSNTRFRVYCLSDSKRVKIALGFNYDTRNYITLLSYLFIIELFSTKHCLLSLHLPKSCYNNIIPGQEPSCRLNSCKIHRSDWISLQSL